MYEHHMQSLLDYMKQQLDFYYSDPHLTFLVVSSSKVAVMPDGYRTLDLLLSGGYFEALRTIKKIDHDYGSLRLEHLVRRSMKSNVLTILAPILSDQALLGQYAVNGERTMSAALYLLKLVQELLWTFDEWKIPCLQIQLFRAGYSEHPILHNPSRFQYPWKWRRTPVFVRPDRRLEARKGVYFDRIHWTFVQKWPIALQVGIRNARVLKLSIQLLLTILPEADHSPLLTDFVRGPTCGLILRFFERNDAKKLKEGIESYLRTSKSRKRQRKL
ncbi:hypothetical protein CVT26_001601 [Gymnopilus dilepis]|uniref:Uncharacterized protein n=1 Tax=Gymnopilus dilepis TaxID=231916 RepID=A0A409YXE6_9AGAR|nr:hypothetical protein CVT26_001601 [Gymnopilus dilepis]